MTTLISPVSVAIAGLGDVSHQHKRAIDLCNNARLAGVWTRNHEKLSQLSHQWDVRHYPDYDALLDDETIQVVDITVDDPLHLEFTLRALDAGKHVIVEKPPAETPGQVLKMIEAADKNGLRCIPMHNYVYRPKMLQAKRLIDSDRLGALTFGFFSEVMKMPEQWASHYHGVLVTAMYHLIYSSLFLMGKPDSVFAQQKSIHYDACKDDDLTTLYLSYPNGSMAVLLGNWAADDLTANSWFSLYKIIGTHGGVNISGHDALVHKQSGWGNLQWPDYEDTFAHAFDFIVQNCFLEGLPPLSGLDEAAATLNIINLAQKSSRDKRAQSIE